MPSSYSNQDDGFNTAISSANFPRTINCVLRKLHWTDIFIDVEKRAIFAALKETEDTHGKRWEFRYNFSASWVNDSDGTAGDVTFQISELNHAWSGPLCKRKFEMLADAFCEIHDEASTAEFGPSYRKGARWASLKELDLAGYIKATPQNSELLITRLQNDNVISIPERETERHAIVCGPTGSGKTTGIFIPNLIERIHSSAVVTEATGGNGIPDLYHKTSGYRQAHGHSVYYFNPNDPNSHQINPLDLVQTYRDARRISEIIFQSTTLKTHKGDQTWELAERQLLTALILHAVSKRSEGRCNFQFVNELLDGGAKGLQNELLNSPILEARRCFNRFDATCTDGYRNLVINGLMTRVDPWNSPRVCHATARTTIDFESLREKLFTLYMAVPADYHELKPVMAIILNFVIDEVQKGLYKHPLMLLLDEFTNFGAVRGLPAKLTIMRHDGIPVILGVQDYVQLQLLYGEEAKLLISQPGTRIFFKPNDFDTAQRLSQMIGESLQEVERLTSRGEIQDKDRKEPLLGPSDLLALGAIDEANMTVESDRANMIAFLPRTRPLQLEAMTWRDYEAATTAYPVPPVRAETVNEDLKYTSQTGSQPYQPANASDSEPSRSKGLVDDW